MSHTPGTWHVYIDDRTGEPAGMFPGIDSDDGTTIVLWGEAGEGDMGIHGNNPKEALANARLIAAAPDLLAACKHMLDMISNNYPNDWQGIQGVAAAAIARAEPPTADGG